MIYNDIGEGINECDKCVSDKKFALETYIYIYIYIYTYIYISEPPQSPSLGTWSICPYKFYTMLTQTREKSN